jgi:S-adenosylmethionine:tRNA ribosyltransferase-isomerase
MSSEVHPPLDFELPKHLEAHDPPEALGRARDDVRMLVARGGEPDLVDARPSDVPRLLAPGDLLVINVSATLPAALPATGPRGEHLRVHLSTPAPPPEDPSRWTVELRLPRGSSSLPHRGGAPGLALGLPGGGTAHLVGPAAEGADRLWVAELNLPGPLEPYLVRHGEPIRYGRVSRPWPISAYQTVYAGVPGSAEMPSAGRPLTHEILGALAAVGVGVAPIVLLAGVSSPEPGEPPVPERWHVSASTARAHAAARAWGGRVVAVGTTVVRALETAAGPDGGVSPGEGWTELVVSPERGVRAVDGLITGWHEPGASHLALLEAVAGRDLVAASYRAALERGYRWHEFGDLHLLLP